MKPAETHLYEYAVVRFVPRPEREEFLNIGLVMMCKRRRWIRVDFLLRPERLAALGGDISLPALDRQLDSFRGICRGDVDAGPLAAMTAEERFRWLTAVRSAAIRTSRPHPGHAADLDATFDRLFAELVL